MTKVHSTDKEHLEKLRNNVNKFTFKFIDSLTAQSSVLEIGPQEVGGIKSRTLANVKTLDLTKDNNPDIIGDLCNYNLHIENDSFDKILCTEVLEHTVNPFNAVKELHRILKKGGELWVSTPLNFRIHGPSPDCWRFTREGLYVLFEEWDISTIEELPSDRFLFPIQYLTIAVK